MSDLKSQIMEKLRKVKDLTQAILLVRQVAKPKAEVTKAEPLAPQEPDSLKHVGQYLGAPGYITHVIGTGKEGQPHYKMSVNMKRLAQGEPHITVDVHGHDGSHKGKSHKLYANIKEAVRDILNHFHNGDWHK